MALPSSGAISLNQMHVEAGGTSGSQVSLNDADIRDMIDKSSGSQMCFSEWYGASSGPNIERGYSWTQGNYAVGTWSSWWGYSGFAGNQSGSEIKWSNTTVAQQYTAFRTGTQNMNFWLGSYVGQYHIDNNETILNTCPFPAHTNAVSGWWYYHKRGDIRQDAEEYADDFDYYVEVFYHANRVDSNSSYPH